MESTFTLRLTQQELLSRLLERNLDDEFETRVEQMVALEDHVRLVLVGPGKREFSVTGRVLWRRPAGLTQMDYRVKMSSRHLPDYREWVVGCLADAATEETVTLCDAPVELTPTSGLVRSLFAADSGSSDSQDLPEAGDLLGRKYSCVCELGRGAGTVILRATQPAIAKPVSLKLITDTESKEHQGDRFLHEARVMAALDTPHVPTVFDFGVDQRHGPFLVMENLKGSTLADLLDASSKPMDLSAFFELAIELVVALDAVHRRGMVHANLRPRCAWVTDETNLDGRRRYVKLFDFGMTDSQQLKKTHVDGYLAPEQLAGAAVTTRTDVYSLGAIFFRMLSGVPPFQPTGADGFRISADPQVDALVRSMMALSPDSRPESAQAIYDRLCEMKASLLARCA